VRQPLHFFHRENGAWYARSQRGDQLGANLGTYSLELNYLHGRDVDEGRAVAADP
jgi:hypothetical protein